MRLLVETAGKRGGRKGISKAEQILLAKVRFAPAGKELAAELDGLPGLPVSFREQMGENHGSLLLYVVANMLSFILAES